MILVQQNTVLWKQKDSYLIWVYLGLQVTIKWISEIGLLYLYKESFWPSRLGHHFHYSFYILWSVVSVVESFCPKSSLWFLFSVIFCICCANWFCRNTLKDTCLKASGEACFVSHSSGWLVHRQGFEGISRFCVIEKCY